MRPRQIQEITILPGRTKTGETETFREIVIRPGDTISIVGPTGSGKSAFINDIEVFAQGDTVTGRRVMVNGKEPPEIFIRDPAHKPIALISQNTRCISDMCVGEFLEMHVKSRKIENNSIVRDAVSLANEFTGEKINASMKMTALSGGQTRALMVADAVLISDAPLILLDEVENAGIFKEKVIRCLKQHRKSVIFVTHDPFVSLLSERRIVMGNGAVRKILEPGERERDVLEFIRNADAMMSRIREQIRSGNLLTVPVV